MSVPPRILIVAGSDSGGAAGIQADIRTVTALGAFATTAITALTAQNTRGVQAIHAVPAEFVAAQIKAIMDDIGADALKTGMLPDAACVRVVVETVKRHRLPIVVVDPVIVAQSGDRLIPEEAVDAVVGELFPLAMAVTPNLAEASRLVGESVASLDAMRAAARRIQAMGPRFVIVKGGHLEGGQAAVDVLYDGRELIELSAERLPSGAHGSGCTFASALATFLAKGLPIREAVPAAKSFVRLAIRHALTPGKGRAVINPAAGAK